MIYQKVNHRIIKSIQKYMLLKNNWLLTLFVYIILNNKTKKPWKQKTFYRQFMPYLLWRV